MQVGDCIAARLFKEAGNQAVDETGERRPEHLSGKEHRLHEMFAIGLIDRRRMLQKHSSQHVRPLQKRPGLSAPACWKEYRKNGEKLPKFTQSGYIFCDVYLYLWRSMGKIDSIDRKIITVLQTDAAQSVSAIGEAVGLSQNAAWRRIRRLEDEGYLKARVAIFDAEKLGFPLTAFAILRVREHSEEWLSAFAKKILAMPEIVEFYRMSGDIDYMAKIICRDMKHYDEIYKRIIASGPIQDVSTSFAMEGIKCTTAAPIEA